MTKKVFVSSIIEGFEPYRAAARQAVALVGLVPVMAEDFPAQPRAPRTACLNGVRSSDIYVGILGPSYGSRTESGRSATEEEFDEACALSLPTLVFGTTAAMDSDQSAFFDRVAGRWGDGIFYGRFSSPEDLKDEVVRALSAIGGQRPALSDAEASSRLEALLGSIKRQDEDVVLGLALVVDAGEHALIPFGELEKFASDLPDLLRCVPQLCRPAAELLAKERSVEVLHRPTRDEGFAFFEAADDGRLLCALGQRIEGRSDLAAGFIIDARQVEIDLVRIIESFSRVLTHLDLRGSTRNAYVQGSLKGVQGKVFDTVPEEPIQSITIPSHGLPNPLPFPSRALSIPIQKLNEPAPLGAALRATIKRIFDEALRRGR